VCRRRARNGSCVGEAVIVTSSSLLGNLAFIVTGSGQGLGRAFARAIAQAGGKVIVADIVKGLSMAVAKDIRDDGGVAVGAQVDVSDSDSCERLVRLADDEFGRLDGLVNNAGVIVSGDSAEESVDAIRRIVDVNILGSVLCGTAAIRAMRAYGNGGSIVNLSSGALQGVPGLALYGMTKGAIASLTYGWALDTEDEGIRCNALAPLASTNMSTQVPGPESARGPDPQAIAPAVLYLLSSLSSEVTGQILRFDGKRMGFVVPGGLTTVTESDQWSPESIADAVVTKLGPGIAPVGLAKTPRPTWV